MTHEELLAYAEKSNADAEVQLKLLMNSKDWISQAAYAKKAISGLVISVAALTTIVKDAMRASAG